MTDLDEPDPNPSGGRAEPDLISILREESLRRTLARLEGDVALTSQPWIHWISILLPIAMMLALVLIATMEFPRTQDVSGWLTTTRGLITVEAPIVGVLEGTAAHEGEEVARGQTLFWIRRADASSTQGDAVATRLRSLLDTQKSELSEQIALSEVQADVEMQTAAEQIAEAESEIALFNQQVALANQQVASAEEDARAGAALVERGSLSARSQRDRTDKLLSVQQSRAGLKQQLAMAIAKLQDKKRDAVITKVQRGDAASHLRQQLAEIEGQEAELASRESARIVAPIEGTIAFLVKPGSPTGEGRPLATIVPAGADLEVELFVPSSAIGFISIGQHVRVLYDAFPYRKFGSYGATITYVSPSTVQPGTSAPQTYDQPVYVVRARPENSAVKAYGEARALHPGMTLRASIKLESRPLVMWLLDPFVSVRGRA